MATAEEKNENQAQEIKALKAQIDALSKIIAKMNAESGTKGATPVVQPVVAQKVSSLDQEVTIVHLVERAPGLTTHISLSNLSIDMSRFGEERTLDRRQAEELAGKCSKLFEKGIICFGEGSEEVARRFALKSTNAYSYANSQFLGKLAVLNVVELEELYNKLCDGQKAFIIEYFKRKIIENDPNFKDIRKVEMLNRVSDGAMSGTILDLNREAEAALRKK